VGVRGFVFNIYSFEHQKIKDPEWTSGWHESSSDLPREPRNLTSKTISKWNLSNLSTQNENRFAIIESFHTIPWHFLETTYPHFSMSKDWVVEVTGVVLETLPGGKFKTQITDFWDGGIVIECYMAGKMRKNLISLIPGDSVLVELSPYDLSKWRIKFRKK
jgi:translation initiation factor IF-1